MTEQEFEQAVVLIRGGDKNGLKEIYLAYVRFIYAVIYEILQNKENTEDVTSDFFIKLWDVAERYEPGRGHRGYLATIARNMAIDYVRKRRREVLTAEPDLCGKKSGAGGVFEERECDFETRSQTPETEGSDSGIKDSGLHAPDSNVRDNRFDGQSQNLYDAGGAHAHGGASGRAGGSYTGQSPVEEEVIGNIALQEALALLKDGERQIINMKILGDMTFREISDTLQMPMGTVTWKYRNAISKLRRCGYEQGFEK